MLCEGSSGFLSKQTQKVCQNHLEERKKWSLPVCTTQCCAEDAHACPKGHWLEGVCDAVKELQKCSPDPQMHKWHLAVLAGQYCLLLLPYAVWCGKTSTGERAVRVPSDCKTASVWWESLKESKEERLKNQLCYGAWPEIGMLAVSPTRS